MSLPGTNNDCFLPEAELLAQARGGSEDAFSELVRRNSRAIYMISKRMLKNHEDAEDTLQNVLLKVYQRLNRFDGRSRFSTWLFRVTFNEALMTLRRNRWHRKALPLGFCDLDSADHGFVDIPDRRQNNERHCMNRELVTKTLFHLNSDLRCAFLLQKGEGWSSQEVADMLGASVETVKLRVFRARQKLRRHIRVLC